MNIFILDKEPKIAAQMYCDKHVPKMILELAQMLSTAHRVHETQPWEGMYKQAYLNHPCTIWVRENFSNYQWAFEHFSTLAEQYSIRFGGKVHKSWAEQGKHLSASPPKIPSGLLTQFAQAMPNEYKDACAVTAYRTYYLNDKKRFARWEKGIEAPDWW